MTADIDVGPTRLHLGESPGVPIAARDAVVSELANINRYPDPECRELCAAIAGHWNIEPATVVVGNGSDELLLLIALALGRHHSPGVVCASTFRGHRHALDVAGRPVREVALAGGQADVAAMKAAMRGAGLAFVCNPHNPSGQLLEREQLRLLVAAATDTTLVVDEAYMDFTSNEGASAMGHAPAGVVTLRTFSKAYGLAGLRIGYAVCQPAQAALLRSAQLVLPFRVNRLAQAAAVAALADQDALRQVVDDNAALREWFFEQLRQEGFEAVSSAANFVTVRVNNAPATARLLEERYDVLVRDTSDMGFVDHVRVSLAARGALARVLAGLAEARSIGL